MELISELTQRVTFETRLLQRSCFLCVSCGLYRIIKSLEIRIESPSCERKIIFYQSLINMYFCKKKQINIMRYGLKSIFFENKYRIKINK